MDDDVPVGRNGSQLAQDGHEPRQGEIPDLVVGDADVEHDLFEPSAALERELDLDRRLPWSEEDGVGEMLPPLRTSRELLCEGALALPVAQKELAFEQEANVRDSLDVPNKTVVRLPGAEARAGDARAATRQPDERRQVDRQASRPGPAGLAPAIPEAARGPVAATDQKGELVERDRVLLSDEAEQLLVPLGDLVAAPVPPSCWPGWSCFVEDRVRLFLQLDHSLQLPLLSGLFFWCWCVLPLPPRSRWASLPWWVTSLSQTVLSSDVERGRSRTRSRRRSERQRRPTPHEQTGAGAHTTYRFKANGRAARAGRLPRRLPSATKNRSGRRMSASASGLPVPTALRVGRPSTRR